MHPPHQDSMYNETFFFTNIIGRAGRNSQSKHKKNHGRILEKVA